MEVKKCGCGHPHSQLLREDNMTEKQAKYAKQLRSQIVVYAKRDLGMEVEELHDIMANIGYGNSLRKLSLSSLINLKKLLQGEELTHDYIKFNNQDKMIYAKCLRLGIKMVNLNNFISHKWGKSNLKYMTSKEKGGLIKVLEHYEKERL